MEQGRIERLDKLGFVWNCSEKQWESQYSDLVKFQKVYGHCRVSTLSKTHAALGNWVRTQRVKQRQGKLSAERIRRLDLLGFTWDMPMPRRAADVEGPLTQREGEVLRQIAKGLKNKQIAEALHISYETVREHVQHILRKIGATDRTQAAMWAVRKELT
jgi:DNA-binding NarL/FixJ family response regulator